LTQLNQKEKIKNRLNQIFRDVFDDSKIIIYDEMTAKDIKEWDSLMHISLIVAVEDEFDIRLSTAEIGELKNVGEMINLIKEHLDK
jgi:acyl carrier protein